MIGGYDKDQKLLTCVESYNEVQNKWETLELNLGYSRDVTCVIPSHKPNKFHLFGSHNMKIENR